MNEFRMSIIVLMSLPLCSMGQLKTQALEDLKRLLHSEKEWAKVHVAEFLIWEGYDSAMVYNIFLQEEKEFGLTPKYRIGIWRVLAQATVEEKSSQYWIDKIDQVYKNPENEDYLHAIETLAKLQIYVVKKQPDISAGPISLYSLWNYALGSEDRLKEVRNIIVYNLINRETQEQDKLIASYILRYLSPLSEDEFTRIFRWLYEQNFKPSLHSSLLATLCIASPPHTDKKILDTIKTDLLALKSQRDALSHIMTALSVCGDVDDKEIVSGLYNTLADTNSPDYNGDLHATAAYMVLRAYGKRGEK